MVGGGELGREGDGRTTLCLFSALGGASFG